MPEHDLTAGFVPIDDPAATRTIAPAPDGDPGRTGAHAGKPDAPAPAVPGFEIVRELGRGGMGVVYLARQEKLNRVVALKTILSGGHASPADLARFLAEAEAAASVQHPNAAQVYDLGAHEGRPYFALEYCPGGTLAAKLAGTPFPPAEAADLVRAVAGAVQAAHDRGIVHRDLKPGNVLLAADGTPKVTDFGLARRTDQESTLTATGAVLGSPSYMAPEQARGGAGVGPRTDVYGLAAVLYECLTGRPPFRAATALETITQVLQDDPPPPRVLVPGVPRDLETVCLTGLQKDPSRRYASAAALAADLGRWEAGEPIVARPVPWWERAWKAARRRPAAVAAAAAVALGVVTTVGVVGWKNRELDRERAEAQEAEAEAVRLGAVADRERARATARLGKAVEAIEKMVTRAGTARWSRDPALAAERRQVLEDAVAFYQGFGEAGDPVVRRETARAYRRIGSAYLQLAEFPKAADYLGRGRGLAEGLVAEFPDDPGYAADLAETRLYAAQEAAGTGRVADAHAGFREAAAVARRAAAARRHDDEVRRTFVSCLIGHGFFTMQADPPAAGPVFGEAVREVEDLLTRPAPFSTRALAAYTYAAAATFDFSQRNPLAGLDKLRRAGTVRADTPPDPTAQAHYQDLYDMTGGLLKMVEAMMVATSRPADALPLYREAAGVFNGLVATNPRAFQYRLYQVTILSQEAQVLARLGRTDDARRRRAELLAAEDEIQKTSPNVPAVARTSAVQRAAALVDNVSAGPTPDLDRRVDALLRGPGGETGNVRYNLACALALGSRHGPPADRERRATRAVQLLTSLLDGAFYQGPTNAAHVDRDTDLDPVRDRADFRAFRARLTPPPKTP
jgi:tRNA A-37 threonylcarbamoyl transferase component Bud32/tetratricopeptide (TPR) repeat protein